MAGKVFRSSIRPVAQLGEAEIKKAKLFSAEREAGKPSWGDYQGWRGKFLEVVLGQ